MKKRILIALLCFCLFLPSLAQAGSFNGTIPTVLDPAYNIRVLVPPSTLGHGTNGLNFDSNDNLYVGSVAGVATYLINTDTGDESVYLGSPDGGADDLIFGPDGRVYWTAFFLGKVCTKSADSKVITLADNLPGANAITLNKEGRLFVSQVFLGDALWEIDLSGKQNNRKIAENLGGFNGFAFGPDGYLYGPLWFKGQIAKVDVNTGNVTVVADGLEVPAAVKFDSKGNLFVIDTATGNVYRIDVHSGQKTVVARMEPHLDNLAFDSKDRLFITNMSVNGVYQVDVKTGKVRTVTEAQLCFPQGIAVMNEPDGDILYVADNFSYKKIDAFTGEVQTPSNGAAYPNTASISADGNYVLMSGWFTNNVQVFDRKTDELLYTIPGFKVVAGTLMQADGSVLVAEGSTGNIVKVTDQDGKERSIVATGLENPTFMAQAGSDAVYVTEYTAGRVTKVDLNTGDKKVICSGLLGPKGIAVKPDGKILVLDAGARELLEIDPASGVSKPLVANLAVGQPGVVKGGHPAYGFTGVAVSNSGAIYVTSDLENTVYMIYPK